MELCAHSWAAIPGSGLGTRAGTGAGRGGGWRARGGTRAAGCVCVCVCDFGFDLLGDELIPLYNRLGADRENGCGAICVAMGTIARAWKNTAFVGGACHSLRGDLSGTARLGFSKAGSGCGPALGAPNSSLCLLMGILLGIFHSLAHAHASCHCHPLLATTSTAFVPRTPSCSGASWERLQLNSLQSMQPSL